MIVFWSFFFVFFSVSQFFFSYIFCCPLLSLLSPVLSLLLLLLLLFFLVPLFFLTGFSFACKKWGEILVADLAPIQFDDSAYEKLVLTPGKKHLIRALVDQHQRNRQRTFNDIISGKGGGRIFLLHGPPGVGKVRRGFLRLLECFVFVCLVEFC